VAADNNHPDLDDSLQMALAQIVWWGIGLTLIYDTAETVFGCAHSLAIALYSSLMIVSAWLRVRAMTWIAVLLLPTLLATLYLLFFEGVPGEGLLALWTQMVNVKAIEYIGWLLLVAGSFITGQFMLGNSSPYRTALSFLGLACLLSGGYMMVDSAIISMQASGQSNMTFLVVQQSSYFMWLVGVSSKPPTSSQEVSRRQAIFTFPRLPVKPTVLVIGTLFFVGYDVFIQKLAVGWQYLSMILPPIAMIFRHKLIRYFTFCS
jgi:hypothetical protein